MLSVEQGRPASAPIVRTDPALPGSALHRGGRGGVVWTQASTRAMWRLDTGRACSQVASGRAIASGAGPPQVHVGCIRLLCHGVWICRVPQNRDGRFFNNTGIRIHASGLWILHVFGFLEACGLPKQNVRGLRSVRMSAYVCIDGGWGGHGPGTSVDACHAASGHRARAALRCDVAAL